MSGPLTEGVPSGEDPVELAHWLLDRARSGEAEGGGANAAPPHNT